MSARKLRRVLDLRMKLGLVLVGWAILMAIVGPATVPADPFTIDSSNRLAGPSANHPLGTDEFGRDILARLVYAARPTLAIGAGSVLVATAAGTLLGVLAGYWQGLVEALLMRTVDVLLCFPPIVLAMAAVCVAGPGVPQLVLVLGLLYAPRIARVTYLSCVVASRSLHVEAARALGASDARVLVRHVLPSCVPTILVQCSLTMGFVVLIEAGLSFLGLGPPPPTPTWGGMVSKGAPYLSASPWPTLWPSLAILLTVLGFNLLGDAFRDAMDPKLRY